MAVLFFDTSALVRRYDETEPGAGRVEELCSAAAGNILLITRITSVEVASAFNGKLRLGTIDAVRRDELWRVFRYHRRTQYRNLSFDLATLADAEQLIFRHPLRAYDAIQIATAARAVPVMPYVAGNLRFCTADRRQAEAVAAEGLDVEMID